MTPDMKRLCEAAEEAFYANIVPAADRDELRETLEAIVRAVLLNLREPSEAMDYACDDLGPHRHYEMYWQAMIDHILAETAKA